MTPSTHQNNPWKIAVAIIANFSSFSIGVFIIFMLSQGLSITEASLVVSSYLIASALGQIPSGIFADRFGCKLSILIGSVLTLLGTAIFAFAQNLYMFIIGYAFMGFGAAMSQGADHALLYEGLKADHLEASFKKVVSRVEFATNIFYVIAATTGGLLYSLNPRFPFLAEMVLIFINLIITLSIQEPKINSTPLSWTNHLKNIGKHSFHTSNFSKIFLFSALIGSIALTTFQYLQPLYKTININENYFGLIAAAAYIMRALGAWSAEKVGKMLSIDKYIVLHAAVFGLFLTFLQKSTNLILVFIIIGVFYFLRGLYIPTVSTYINDKVDSKSRATMLSVNSQLLTIISSLSLFIAGYLADTYDLQTTFFGLSIISMVFLILYVLSLRKVQAY